MRVKAIDLIQYAEADINALPDGTWIYVDFSNGALVKSVKSAITLSWYFWDMHRRYPGSEIKPTHMVQAKAFEKGAELDLSAVLFWDIYYGCHQYHSARTEEERDLLVWEMSEALYETINTVYNMTVSKLARYLTTVSLKDVYELLHHPTILAAKQQCYEAMDNPGSDIGEVMRNSFNQITKTAKGDDPMLRDNMIAKMTRAGVLDTRQLLQIIGPRGFVTATDGSTYKEPIRPGYADGLSEIHESMTESRTGSLSLYMNEGALEKSEYFNRQMQLLTSVIAKVVGDDCGTIDTIPCLIGENELKSYGGKFHIVDGVTKEIDITDTSLINTIVHVRSITLCKNHDPTTMCKKCFGMMYKVMPPGTNIGHALITKPLSDISQNMLSTKHIVSSVMSLYLSLGGVYLEWFKYGPDNKSSIVFKKNNNHKYLLRFAVEEAPGLSWVTACDDPSSFSPQRISCVTAIHLAEMGNDGQAKSGWTTFPTIVGSKGSALSTEVLLCIRRNGLKVIGGQIEVILDNFADKEIIITPRRNENILLYLNQIRHFVFGADKKGDTGDCIVSYTNVGKAIAALKRIFDEKISVNFIHSEIVVKACMTVDPQKRNFNLPIGGQPFVFSNAKSILANRSLGAALAYQGQRDLLKRPASYLVKERHHHPLDPLIS